MTRVFWITRAQTTLIPEGNIQLNLDGSSNTNLKATGWQLTLIPEGNIQLNFDGSSNTNLKASGWQLYKLEVERWEFDERYGG